MGEVTCNDIKTNRLHGIPEPLAILSFVDCILGCPDHLNTEFLQHPVTHQVQRAVQSRLTAHRGQQYVGTLFFDNERNRLPGNRLNVGGICELGISHDRCGIGVHQNDPITLLPKGLTGLHSRVVEFTGLPNDNRARADHQH